MNTIHRFMVDGRLQKLYGPALHIAIIGTLKATASFSLRSNEGCEEIFVMCKILHQCFSAKLRSERDSIGRSWPTLGCERVLVARHPSSGLSIIKDVLVCVDDHDIPMVVTMVERFKKVVTKPGDLNMLLHEAVHLACKMQISLRENSHR